MGPSRSIETRVILKAVTYMVSGKKGLTTVVEILVNIVLLLVSILVAVGVSILVDVLVRVVAAVVIYGR